VRRFNFSQPLSCFRCHGGFTFSGAVDFEGRRDGDIEFHNTGLYNLAGALSYPSPNTGIYEITRKPEDVGKFKAPTLRNIAVTGTLHARRQRRDARGGDRTLRRRRTDDCRGPESWHRPRQPGQEPDSPRFCAGAAEQRDDVIAFLRCLTDEPLLHDRRFSNPWTTGAAGAVTRHVCHQSD